MIRFLSCSLSAVDSLPFLSCPCKRSSTFGCVIGISRTSTFIFIQNILLCLARTGFGGLGFLLLLVLAAAAYPCSNPISALSPSTPKLSSSSSPLALFRQTDTMEAIRRYLKVRLLFSLHISLCLLPLSRKDSALTDEWRILWFGRCNCRATSRACRCRARLRAS